MRAGKMLLHNYHGPLADTDFVADLARVLDHSEIEQCHVLGLSKGVSIAIDYSDQYPGRVKSLVFSGRSTDDGHAVTRMR